MPMTFPASNFRLGNQDSCHRRRADNPLNRNQFQFTARKPFRRLPFLTANFAYETGRPFERATLFERTKRCCRADCCVARSLIGLLAMNPKP
jgi:hypothetical protein